MESEKFKQSLFEETTVYFEEEEANAPPPKEVESEDKKKKMKNKTLDKMIKPANETEGNSTAILEEERPLPSPYLPDAIPLFLLFLFVAGLILYQLMCRWFVWFKVGLAKESFVAFNNEKVMTQYEQTSAIIPGLTFAFVIVNPHKGKDDLVLVYKNALTDQFEFAFQKQTYEFLKPEEYKKEYFVSERGNDAVYQDDDDVAAKLEKETRDADLIATAQRLGFVRLVVAKVDSSIASYLNSKGVSSAEELDLKRSKFGRNSLVVPQPPFAEILKSQLLMPLSVFQIFSALLWAVDEVGAPLNELD